MRRVNGVYSFLASLSIVLFLSACQPAAVPTDNPVPTENAPRAVDTAESEAEVSAPPETAPTPEEKIANAMSAGAGLLGTIAFALGILLVLAWVRYSRGELRMDRAIARYAPLAARETAWSPSAPAVALDSGD